jgi:hypothetical protein
MAIATAHLPYPAAGLDEQPVNSMHALQNLQVDQGQAVPSSVAVG